MARHTGILRFFGDTEAAPPIALSQLAEVEARTKTLLGLVPSALGATAEIAGDFKIEATPRQACLEIPLLFDLSTQLVLREPQFEQGLFETAKTLHELLKEYKDDVGLLLTLLFGKYGILSMLKRRGQKAQDDSPQTVRADELILQLSQSALENPHVVAGVRRVTEAAAATGARKVTIQVDQHPEISLYDRADRQRRGVIGSTSNVPPSELQAPSESGMRTFHQEIADVIQVEYDGIVSRAFIAEIDQSRCIVIWGSKQEPPSFHPIRVLGRWVDRNQVTPIDAAPLTWDAFGNVFLVEGVVTVT